MKTITFKYTKKDKSVSERTLLALVTPGDKYAGIDVSELDPVDANNFMTQANELHAEYIAKLAKLQVKFDLEHNFRQFLASGVSELSEI